MIQQLQYVQAAKTSVLLVSDADYEQFIVDCEHNSHYLTLIPAAGQESIDHLNLIRDLYFALHHYHDFVSHPNLSMIYVLRHTLVQELTRVQRFHMLHAICKRTPHVTLLMAVMLATLLEEELSTSIREEGDAQFQESFAFVNQFPSLDILYLYNEQADLQNTYPKDLAKAQALTANFFRTALRDKQPVFQKRLQHIATFAQHYVSLRK